MHPDVADQSEWPTCAAAQGPGTHRLWVDEIGRQVCRPCEDKTRDRLSELPGMFARLNSSAALMRGARRGGNPTSGSRTPPIPPRLEVLSLTSAGGVATRLQAIEDSWRAALGWDLGPRAVDGRVLALWRGSPTRGVPARVKFLLNNLLWAADAYESVGDDVEEVRRLHAECTAALTEERKPGRVSIGLCPVPLDGGPCAAPLTATTANTRVRCGSCGTQWADMGEWRELRRAQEALNEEVAA